MNSNPYPSDWEWVTIKAPTEGVVLSYQKAGPCGIITFTAIAAIKTSDGDTIRVFDLCNDTVYHKAERIIIEPAEKIVCWFTLSRSMKKYTFKKTCYGHISKK